MAEPRIPKEVRTKQLKKYAMYHDVFKSPQGRKVLHDLFVAHNMMQTTYVANDPIAMAMREGERNVVLRILTILETSPQELAKRIEDANAEESY